MKVLKYIDPYESKSPFVQMVLFVHLRSTKKEKK